MAHDKYISFGIDLIHRDSPQSPFYNKSLSQSELLAKDVQRSHARVNLFNSSSSYLNDDKERLKSIMEGNGNTYLTRYYLGDQKVKVLAFVDMTSSFISTICDRKKPGVFDPKSSFTYTPVRYNTIFCLWYSFNKSNSGDCAYEYNGNGKGLYASNGLIGVDNFYFDAIGTQSPRAVTSQDYGNLYFGCSKNIKNLESQARGVVGFGRGELSFISQLGSKIKSKFNYCLRSTKQKKASSLLFGDYSPPHEQKMGSSPLRRDPFKGTSYYLNLEGVTLGDSDSGIKISESDRLIKIDCGTPMTFLKKIIYKNVVDSVKQYIQIDPVSSADGFKLCYDYNDLNLSRLPKMKFHFSEASMKLNPSNVFVESDGKLCLAIFPIDNNIPSVFGSQAQVNHIMQFDLENKRISFISHDCNLFA